jgi:hypothetical protein
MNTKRRQEQEETMQHVDIKDRSAPTALNVIRLHDTETAHRNALRIIAAERAEMITRLQFDNAGLRAENRRLKEKLDRLLEI